MSRQLTTIFIVILSLLAAASIYFFVFENNKKKTKPSIAIPKNACLIIEVKDPAEQLSDLMQTNWFNLFTEQPDLGVIKNQVLFLDSLLIKSNAFESVVKSGEIAFSLHAYANKTFGLFISVQTNDEININHVVNFLNLNFNNRFVYTKRKFNNEVICDFTDFVTKNKFSISFKKGLLLFSFDGSLCELALLKLKQEADKNTDPLDFVYQSNEGINVYVNPQNMPLFFGAFMPIGNEFNIPLVKRLCKTMAFNVGVNDDEIKFKGASLTHDTLFQYLDLLNAQAPVDANFDNIIPDNFNYAFQLNLSDYNGFYTNLKEYLFSRGLYNNYKYYVDSLEQHLQISFIQNFGKYIGNGAALISINQPGIYYDSANIVMLKINDINGVNQLLNSYVAAIHKKYPKDTSEYEVTNEEIKSCTLGSAFKIFWGDAFCNVNFNHYFLYNNYLVYSSNKDALLVYLKDLQQGNLAIKNTNYKIAKSNLVKQANIEFMVNGKNAYMHSLYFINNQLHSFLGQNANYFNRISYAAVQVAGSLDRTFITNGYVKFNTKVQDKNKELWQINLDTLIIGKPCIVYNSQQNQQIILAQDKNNMLNFITTEGAVFRKIQIDDEIISSIEMVDLYKNGKSFYLFNTKKFIYLLTEDGKPAYGWPVWIPTGTNLPVTYFEPNQNFMVFVTGNLYKISAFNLRGQLLNGFNPKNVWPNITSSIKSFNYQGKICLYGLNQNGGITTFDEYGHDFNLIKTDSLVNLHFVNINNLDSGSIIINGLDSNYIYAITQSSYKPTTINKTFVGKLNTFNYGKSEFFEDVLLAYNHNTFSLFDKNLNMVVKKEFNDSSLAYVTLNTFGKNVNLVYVLKNNLFIENLNGKIQTPFPQPCNTNYTIKTALDGGNYLIFGFNNTLKLYKIK